MTIEAIISGALAVLIVSLAYGWYSAHCEAEYYRKWLGTIALSKTPRNNASILKRIAREALTHD
jgi:hypothetical protein